MIVWIACKINILYHILYVVDSLISYLDDEFNRKFEIVTVETWRYGSELKHSSWSRSIISNIILLKFTTKHVLNNVTNRTLIAVQYTVFILFKNWFLQLIYITFHFVFTKYWFTSRLSKSIGMKYWLLMWLTNRSVKLLHDIRTFWREFWNLLHQRFTLIFSESCINHMFGMNPFKLKQI